MKILTGFCKRRGEFAQEWFHIGDQTDRLQRLVFDRSFHCRRIDIDTDRFTVGASMLATASECWIVASSSTWVTSASFSRITF